MNLYSIETEKAIIGCMLYTENCINYGLMQLKSSDFWETKNRLIFEAIKELTNNKSIIDSTTVMVYLKDKNIGTWLSSCMDEVRGLSEMKEYCTIVRNFAYRRAVCQASQEIIEKAEEIQNIDELASESERLLFQALNREDVYLFHTMTQATQFSIDRMQLILSGYKGINTGYKELDKIIVWMEEGDFNIIAGRPSMGKSLLAASIAKRMAKNNVPVAIFNLEMTTRQTTDRWISDESEIDAWKIKYSPDKIDIPGGNVMQKTVDYLNKLPIYLDETPGLDYYKMISKIKLLHRKYKIKVVFIDHIGLVDIHDNKMSDYQKLGIITKGLKNLAKELKITINGLAQLSRGVEHREDKRPMMSDIRECGKIEENSDVIMLLYRDEYYNQNTDKKGILTVWVAKDRNGKTGSCDLAFIPGICRISDLS